MQVHIKRLIYLIWRKRNKKKIFYTVNPVRLWQMGFFMGQGFGILLGLIGVALLYGYLYWAFIEVLVLCNSESEIIAYELYASL